MVERLFATHGALMAERTPRKVQNFSDWANRPPAAPTSAQSEKQQRLWTALNEYIAAQGGWVTSLPNKPVIRIECVQGSALPAKLIQLGYFPRHCGAGQRLVPGGAIETIVEHSSSGEPISRRYDGIIPVDVIEIEIPGR